MNRESICSQQIHCLRCPLSVLRTGKDCRELTAQEIERIIQEVREMSDTKCCENCYYGEVWAKRERLGIPCCVICWLRSNMFKGKFELHSKDDKCRKWRKEDD